MNQSNLLQKNLPPALQVFYRPMLLISLGLHGLILMLPMPPEQKPSPKPEPPKKQENIKISQLLAPPSQPSPKPSPVAKPSPKNVVRQPTLKPTPRRVVLSTPVQRPVTPPIIESKPKPTPTPEATPKAAATPEPTPTPKATPKAAATPEPTPTTAATPEPTPTTAATPEPTPTTTATPEPTPTTAATPEPTPSPSPDPGAEALRDIFGQVEGVPDELVDGNLFEQPELFFTQESLKADPLNPVKQPGIVRIKWISLKSPDEFLSETLKPGVEAENLKLDEKGEYGGGTLYELKKGDTVVRYVSLLKSKGSKGTLFVLWDRNPQSQAQ